MFKRLRLVVTSRPVDPDAGSSQFCRFTSDKWPQAELPEHKQQRQIPCPVFSEDGIPNYREDGEDQGPQAVHQGSWSQCGSSPSA